MTQQLTLFEPSRLAHRPYCTDDLTTGLVIRGVKTAVTKRYVQANSPGYLFRIVLDLDHNVRCTADMHSWASDFRAPMPNWSALNASNPHYGFGHIGYEIEVPIGTHDHARSAPIRLAAAVESGLIDLVNADTAYAGLICKNPLNAGWHTVIGRDEPYGLAELSDYLDLTKYSGKKAQAAQGSIGRNCTLFDGLRKWSYAHLSAFKGQSIEAWHAAVEAHAVSINHFHNAQTLRRDALAFSEVRATSRSVAQWTWTHFGQGKAHTDFIATQRHRSGLAATAKRLKTGVNIRAAHALMTAAGGRITASGLAKRAGVGRSTLYECYGELLAELGVF